ncbi:MAG: hypothetical protein AAGN15_24335 [Cyanobacteria bacterium J06581_3]
MYLWLLPAAIALIFIYIVWNSQKNAQLSRKIGTYQLITGEGVFYLGGDVPTEHWVRLAAHIVGSRLFYFRGTQQFHTLLAAARVALNSPVVKVLSHPSEEYAQESGVLTYAGVGLKGFIGGPDDRPVRYQREVEGIIRWVLEDKRTAAEAKAILPKIIEQESDPTPTDLGTVNKRIRKHFQ